MDTETHRTLLANVLIDGGLHVLKSGDEDMTDMELEYIKAVLTGEAGRLPDNKNV